MYNRTIGERLKSERENSWISLDEVANATKINKKFLESIENNEFSDFTSHTQAIGFIKIYAKFLKIDSSNLIAIYKRDFEAEKLKREINIIDDEELTNSKKKFNFKITSKRIFTSIALSFITIFIILTINFVKNAFAPPYFKITSPAEFYNGETKEFTTSLKTIKIQGETYGYTLIKLNEVPLVLNSGFTFESEEIPITAENNKFIIKAESQLGVKSESVLNIIREDIVKKNAAKELIITTKAPGVYVKATGDNLVQFNDTATQNIKISISFKENIEIETDNFSQISIEFNGKSYTLKSNLGKFKLEESGNLIQL